MILEINRNFDLNNRKHQMKIWQWRIAATIEWKLRTKKSSLCSLESEKWFLFDCSDWEKFRKKI